jgi:GT2 family glycosyltransferase
LNLALREAKGDVIVRVDGHCEVAVDYVRQCVQLLKDSGAGCVGGPLQTVGETGRARAIAAALSSKFGVGGATFRVGSTAPKFVDTVAFPGYKRETLRRLGEFDEELVRNQDDEYNYRLRKSGDRILLSPALRARYYSRATFKSLFRQYFQYGYWKVRVLQKHPGQMQLRQFMPLLGVVGLSMLLLLTPFVKSVAVLTAVFVLLYLLASVFASALTAKRAGWKLFTFLPIAFGIIHFSYGLGFLFGLIKFWNRWTGSTPINVANVPGDATPLSAD